MPRLLISPRAILDLIEIWNYIADDSEEHADIFIDKLNEAMEKLRHNPSMGRQRDELAPHMRSFPFQRYVIFYRGGSSAVEIVRFLHGAPAVEEQFLAAPSKALPRAPKSALQLRRLVQF